MSQDAKTTQVTLQLPSILAQRLEALSVELGGPSAVVERALLMAPVSARRALLCTPPRGEGKIYAQLSHDELERIGVESAKRGMDKGAWVRSVVRARLQRAPQLSVDEARANSAVRVELLRISDRLAVAVDEIRKGGGDPQAVVDCWRSARLVLEQLRAALVGNLLYWSPLDD